MTDRIEREAVAIIERIDATGGTLSAIEAGVIQREVQESAYRAQQAIDAGDVGGRRGEPVRDAMTSRQSRCSRSIRRSNGSRWSACVRCAQLARRRDLASAIDAVVAAARDGSNVVPAIIDAVEARATVGEISDAMRTVFGEHQETSTT